MKIGRNDPCPCGSGKKYKNCCLPKKSDRPEALEYRRLIKVHDALIPKLMRCAVEIFGRMVGPLAVSEFVGWPEEDEAPEEEALERFHDLFVPWFLFNWRYDRSEDPDGILGGVPEGRTVAGLYLEAMGRDASPDEVRLIRAAEVRAYSFFEILAIDPGRTVGLRDVLSGREVTVQDHLGSLTMMAGGILFGRVIEVGGVAMFLGLGPNILPPGVKPELTELRRLIARNAGPITEPVLTEWGVLIRKTFVGIDRRLHAGPQLQNTDDDRLEFHRLVYDIDSPHEAVVKLAPLCKTATPAKIRAGAETDESGRIVGATIAWTRKGNRKSKGMDNTLLGTIEIDGSRMTVSVNSAERAHKIRAEIERRMGGAARFQLDEIQDLEAMMDREDEPDRGVSASQEELMRIPEVREQLARLLAGHWEGWTDEKIPALGGRTPRQAVRTADGREAVEALLREAERVSQSDPMRWSMEEEMLAGVRRRLKLDWPLP